MDNQLNFNRIKSLCHDNGITMEQMSERLGRSYSGFRRAVTHGSFNAEDMAAIAAAISISMNELYDYLQQPDEVNEAGGRYVKRRKLIGIKDPLEFLRALQSNAEALESLLEKHAKKP